MSRKLWTAVLVTVLLMILGGSLPGRVPASWLAAGSAAWEGVVARVPEWRTGAASAGSALADEVVARLPALERGLRSPEALVAGAGFLAVLAGACLALTLAGRRRDPFRTVVRLAGRGRPVASVARRTRLAQDAVRTLLRPDRPRRPRPRWHRKEASAAEGLTPRKDRRPAAASGGMRWVVSG